MAIDAAPAIDAPPAIDAAPMGCPPGGGPTTHGSVNAAETWTAAGSPHVLRGDVTLYAPVTLEPCAELRIPPLATVTVSGGSIIANGTADFPIKITATDPSKPWARIRIYGGSGVSRLVYTTVEGGGDPLNSVIDTAGMIEVVGADGTKPPQDVLFVDHATLRGSASNGMILSSSGAFAAASTALTITGSARYPISAWALSAGSIPPGSYTGNARDEILLQASLDTIFDSITLHQRGVPYRVGSDTAAGQLRVTPPPSAAAGTQVTLTIEPGVTMRFKKGASLNIEVATGTTPARAALVAAGTAEAPIVFTSAEATPAPGDWLGIWFGLVPLAANRIDHARVEYAGGLSQSGGSACPGDTWPRNDAAIRIFGPPPMQFVTNTTIAASAGHGIDRGWRDDSRLDFLPSNTFENITWCFQTWPSLSTGGCPAKADVPCPR